MMKKALSFGKPSVVTPLPEAPAQITMRDRLISLVEVNLLRFPFVQPLRILWHDLQSERHNWPFLLPVLAYIGWRTYRQERRKATGQEQ